MGHAWWYETTAYEPPRGGPVARSGRHGMNAWWKLVREGGGFALRAIDEPLTRAEADRHPEAAREIAAWLNSGGPQKALPSASVEGTMVLSYVYSFKPRMTVRYGNDTLGACNAAGVLKVMKGLSTREDLPLKLVMRLPLQLGEVTIAETWCSGSKICCRYGPHSSDNVVHEVDTFYKSFRFWLDVLPNAINFRWTDSTMASLTLGALQHRTFFTIPWAEAMYGDPPADEQEATGVNAMANEGSSLGPAEEFWVRVKRLVETPSKKLFRDKPAETMFIFVFPERCPYQLHIHVSTASGRTLAAHLKDRLNRHWPVNLVDAQMVLMHYRNLPLSPAFCFLSSVEVDESYLGPLRTRAEAEGEYPAVRFAPPNDTGEDGVQLLTRNFLRRIRHGLQGTAGTGNAADEDGAGNGSATRTLRLAEDALQELGIARSLLPLMVAEAAHHDDVSGGDDALLGLDSASSVCECVTASGDLTHVWIGIPSAHCESIAAFMAIVSTIGDVLRGFPIAAGQVIALVAQYAERIVSANQGQGAWIDIYYWAPHVWKIRAA